MVQRDEPKDVATLLNDKIQTVRGEQSSTILVGPIKLPVNLEGETVVFQWYCWLPVRDEEDRQDLLNATAETIVKRLSTLDLAEGQQSSVFGVWRSSTVGKCISSHA